MAESDAESEARFDRIVHEYYRAVEAGESVDPEAFISRHAGHECQLRSFFADLRALGDLRGLGAMERTVEPSGSRKTHSQHLSFTGNDRVTYIGQYRLLEEIARGGMGVVFKARQEKLGRVVALKMILSGPLASSTEIDRFRREARAAAQLNHPNIVSVYEIGQHDGRYFFTMGYVESDSLADRLRQGSMSIEESAHLVETIARAMQYAHGEGVLHRDLKPANILIDKSGQPYITDFGLAKAQADVDQETIQEMTRAGQILGTPSYMPPEQAGGKSELVDVRSDVYSLGAILYACLAGRAPFVGESSFETLQLVLRGDPPSVRLLNSRVPKDLETICHKALSTEPRHRYSTAEELAADLKRFRDGHPVTARPVSTTARVWRWSKRNPVIASLSALSLVLLMVGTGTSTFFAIEASERAETESVQRRRADREAAAARLSRTQADESLRVTKSALLQSQWNLYRMSLFPMFENLSDQNIAVLEGQVSESEPQANEPDFRHWEWHFLRQNVAKRSTPWSTQQRYRFVQHNSPGNRIALRVVDGPVEIRNAETFELVRTLDSRGQRYFDWHPEHDWIAVATGENGLTVWDVSSGKQIAQFTSKHPMHPPDGRAVSWSPSGDRIAFGASGHIDFFTLDDQVIEPARCRVSAQFIEWSPDGSRLGVGGPSLLEVIRVQDGKTLWSQYRRRVPIGAIRWSPAGKTLAASWDYPDYHIKLYDREGKVQATLQGEAKTSGIEWNESGTRLISGGRDQSIHWWDRDRAAIVRSLKVHSSSVESLSINADASTAVTVNQEGDARFIRLALQSNHELQLNLDKGASWIRDLRWHPSDPALLAVFGWHQLHLIDAHSGHVIHSLPFDSGALNPSAGDQRYAAIDWHPTDPLLSVLKMNGDVLLLDVLSGKPLSEMRSNAVDFATSVDWKRDGRHLLLGAGLKRPSAEPFGAEIWDALEREKVDVLTPWAARVTTRWSPDGTRVATYGKVPEGKFVQIWDAESHEMIAQSDRLVGFLPNMEYSPDGTRIALGGHGGKLYVLDAQTADFAANRSAHSQPINSIDWSPDGKRLLTASEDESLCIWDAATLDLITTRRDEFGRAAGWSSDGRRLASCTKDGRFRIWDSGKTFSPATTSTSKRSTSAIMELYQERSENLLGKWKVKPQDTLSDGSAGEFGPTIHESVRRQVFEFGGAIGGRGAYVVAVEEDRFERFANSMRESGFRINSMYPYQSKGATFFAATWALGSDQCEFRLGLSKSAFVSAHERMTQKDLRLVDVAGFMTDSGKETFCGVWQKQPERTSQQIVLLSVSEPKSNFQRLSKDHKPTLRQVYFTPTGERRFCEVWESNQSDERQWYAYAHRLGVALPMIQRSRFDRFPVRQFQIVRSSNQRQAFCSGVWHEEKSERITHMIYDEPDNVFNVVAPQMLAGGLIPVKLTLSHGWNLQPLYCAIWER